MVQAPTIEENVEKPPAQRAQQSRSRDAAPKALKGRACRIRAALGVTIDEHGGIHRSRGSPRNPVDLQPRLLEQAIESAPSKGAVRAAALQREIDQNPIAMGGLAGCHRCRLSRINILKGASRSTPPWQYDEVG